MMWQNLFERSSVFLNISILPLLLICGDDPNPQHRPATPVIQLPQPDARVKPLKAPVPKYRFDARQKHWEGTGLIDLAITRDGHVTGVTVLQSTGHAMLDRDAVDALRGWRFKPSRGVDRVRIPITFSLHCSP
jgi:protein TonB